MLFTTPEQFLILAIVLLSGWLLGYASAPSIKKWKRRVRAQSDSFTAYHTDNEDKLRAANQRAADLKAEADALRADHAEAERTILGLRAAQESVARRSESGAPHRASITAAIAERATVAEVAAAPEGALVETGETFSDRHIPSAAPDHAGALQADAVAPAKDLAETAAPVVAPQHPLAPIDPTVSELPRTGGVFGGARDDLARIRGIDGEINTRLFSLGVVRFEDLEKLSAEDEMALEQRLMLPVGYIAREQWRTQAALLRAGQDEAHTAQYAPVETGAPA